MIMSGKNRNNFSISPCPRGAVARMDASYGSMTFWAGVSVIVYGLALNLGNVLGVNCDEYDS